MKSALVIARRELAGYVSTPTGWIVAAVMLLVDGLLFYALALGPAAGPRLSAEVLARFFWTTSGLVPIAAVALSVAHRAYVLETGRVILSGSAAELQEHPEVRRAYLGEGA